MFLSKRVTLIAGCVLVMAIALSVAILPTAESFDPPNQTGTGTLIESNQTSTVAQQGEWRLVEAGEASSGSYLVSADGTENVLSLIFEGTTVEIQYVQGPDLGTLAIEIDGTVVRTIDTTSDTAVFGDRATIDYLDDDVHILRVYPAEGKVAVDAFWATPSQFSTPTPTGTPEVPDYFYYYQDQKIPLVLSTEWIAVRFGTNDPAARQQAVAQTSALMGNVTDGPEYASFEITLVPLAEGIDQRSVEALLAAGPAEDVTAIEAIFPVFAAPDYDGGLLILTDEFIARFAEDRDEDQIAAFNTANGVEAIAALEGLDNTYVLRVTDDSALNALDMANFYHDSNMTVYAEPNFVMQVQPTAEPTDINYGDQWYLNNTGGSGEGGGAQEADADIDWQEAWDARVPADESEVVVAILDDNFDVYHPDLVNKYVTSSLWRNYPDGTSGASAFDVPAVDGFDNHGTTLAGIVAAETDNNEGIAGVCWNCKVLPIRVLDWSSTNTVLDNPATNPTYIVSGINHAQGAGGADVILIGWTMASSTTVDNIIETAVALGREQKGTVIVAAAGHKVGGANAVAYPANRSDVVSVGATNWCDYFHVNVARYNQNNNSADCNNDGLDWGTNYGNKLLISAPGMNLYTTDRSGTDGYGTGNYTNISGTSGSAAIVAGVVGLVLSYNPDLNYQQTADFLYNSADDVKPTYHGIGWDQYTGYGRVNAYNALEFAKGTTPATLDRPWQGYPTYGGDLTYEISDIPSEGEWVYIEVKTDADVVQIGQWYELSSTCSTPGGACYCDTQAATCEITPGVMLDGGTYRWRVKFWESGVGDLPWSNLVTFLINAPEGYTDPDGPLIFYPDGESDNLIASHHEGDPYYIWDHVNAPYYELYIADINGKAVWDEWYEVQAFCPENNDEICVQCSDDPDGDGPLRGQCQVYPTAKSANDDFLLPGTGWYRWWVRAWGESEGYGPWSVAEWFELDPGSIPNQPTIPGTSGSEEEGNPTSFENPYEVIFWDHEDGNSWYEVYLKNTTTGKLVFRKWYKAGPIGCYDGSNACQVAPPTPYIDGHTYSFWVRGFGPGGYGEWSTERYVVANLNFPDPAIDGTELNNGDVTYRWEKGSTFTWFEVYIKRDSTLFHNKWYEVNDTLCPTELCELSPGDHKWGTHEWWIRGYQKDYGYTEWVKGLDVVVPDNRSQVPSINRDDFFINDGSGSERYGDTGWVDPFSSDSLDYTWRNTEDVTWYRLYIAETDGTVVYDVWHRAIDLDCDINYCSVTPQDLYLSNGQYNMWVGIYGANFGGVTIWSEAAPFSVDAGTQIGDTYNYQPATVDVEFNTAAEAVSNLTLTWNETMPDGATRYYVYLKNTTTNTIWLDGKTPYTAAEGDGDALGCTSGGSCSFTPQLELPSGDYLWWVFAQGPYGNSGWLPAGGVTFTLKVYHTNSILSGDLKLPVNNGVLGNDSVTFAFEPIEVPYATWFRLHLYYPGEAESYWSNWYPAGDICEYDAEVDEYFDCQITFGTFSPGAREWAIESWNPMAFEGQTGTSPRKSFTRLERLID